MSEDSAQSNSSSPNSRDVRECQPPTVVGHVLNISFALIALIFILSGGTFAQTQPRPGPSPERRLGMRPGNRQIPDATPPYTPEEAKWWQDLREAAKAVEKTRGGKKESQKFLDVLQEGQEKPYQPPVPDTKPFILSKALPSYNEQARRDRINGMVELSVELRADGYVGEVEIIKGLGHGLDERAADAARRTIFLPAVKDRKFARYRVQMEMNFNIY